MSDPTITFRVSQELYDKAKAKAKRGDITLSQVLRRCLRQWVSEDRKPKEEAIEQD
jgi:antitoxin component of RelBE/YafQ-DinJ toxin-antitoxin module